MSVSSTLRTIDDASEPLRMFGELLEPKIRMLDFAIFFLHSHPSRIVCTPNEITALGFFSSIFVLEQPISILIDLYDRAN